MFKIVCLYLLLLTPFLTIGQEICNNGIDDDLDGLIDLNDSECDCQIIPNPSFELMNCCPANPQEITCSSSWVNASQGTADYYNSCGYVFPGSAQTLPSGGDGYVGFGTNPLHKEYIGVCLSSPFIAGQQYTISLYLARGWGPTTVELALFGTPVCSDLPWNSSTNCPVGFGSWTQLASQNVNVGSPNTIGTWHNTTLTFTPTVDINAIAIGGGCNSTSGYYLLDNITVPVNLILGDIIETGNLCTNNLELTASSNMPGGTWQWYKNGIALIGETNSTLAVLPYGIGAFSCVYTLGFECTQAHHTVTSPNIAANFSATNACVGDSILFSNSSSTSPGNITSNSWNFGDGNGSSNQENPSYAFSSPGIYNVNLSVTSSEHCNIDTTIAIEIFQNPISFFSNTISCEGEVTFFTDSSTLGSSQNITYNWDFNQDGQIDDYTSSPSYTFTAGAGSYSVYYAILDANGCDGDTTIQVSVLPVPLVNLIDDTILCPNESITLQSASQNTTYIWSTGSTNSSLVVSDPGTYWLEVSLNGCKNSDTTTIDFFSFPNFFLGTDTSICENESLLLDASIIEGNYLWSDGSTSSQFSLVETGTIWIEISNMCGKFTDSINLELNDCDCYVYMPNSFTPNNDNLNDVFQPVMDCNTTDYELIIFDRWGQEIYSTNDKFDSWNGNYMGKELPNDIYTYRLTYTGKLLNVVQKVGQVSIIR